MKRLGRITGFALVMMAALSGPAWAVELGDPNVTITDGNLTISNSGGSFTSRLDVTSPATLTSYLPVRITVGHSTSRFYMQAWGSGRTDVLKNSASISGTGERFILGGGPGTSLHFFANDQYGATNGHLYIQGTPGPTMGFVGIGTKTPSVRLDVAGEVKMTVANITGGQRPRREV